MDKKKGSFQTWIIPCCQSWSNKIVSSFVYFAIVKLFFYQITNLRWNASFDVNVVLYAKTYYLAQILCLQRLSF